jgi:hypothetical protein
MAQATLSITIHVRFQQVFSSKVICTNMGAGGLPWPGTGTQQKTASIHLSSTLPRVLVCWCVLVLAGILQFSLSMLEIIASVYTYKSDMDMELCSMQNKTKLLSIHELTMPAKLIM